VEEIRYDKRHHQLLREEAKYGHQEEIEEVIEAAHISKHHEQVVNNAPLNESLFAEPYVDRC